MKEPMMISQTVACIVEPAVAFAVAGACTSTGVSLICGWIAVIG